LKVNSYMDITTLRLSKPWSLSQLTGRSTNISLKAMDLSLAS
jgi:hypothetical protein